VHHIIEDLMNRTSAILVALWVISIHPAGAQLVPTERSVAINVTSAATTQLVASSGSTKIYVRSWDVLANSAGVFKLEYGMTITNPCDTGPTALTGAYSFSAQSGISRSGGDQPLFIIPQGNALCAVSAGATASFAGSLSYTQD
jgi:hypothetical protein